MGGYFGRIVGSPPGLPGGGITGVLPASGVGARISDPWRRTQYPVRAGQLVAQRLGPLAGRRSLRNRRAGMRRWTHRRRNRRRVPAMAVRFGLGAWLGPAGPVRPPRQPLPSSHMRETVRVLNPCRETGLRPRRFRDAKCKPRQNYSQRSKALGEPSSSPTIVSYSRTASLSASHAWQTRITAVARGHVSFGFRCPRLGTR